MKKENLIQLLRIVEQIENDDSLMMLTEQSLVRSELLQLSDEEAQVILKSEALRKQFLKIKLYSEAQYRLLDHFIQQEIVDRLYFISEPEILSYALRVATNAGVLKRNDVLALIETIADTEKVFQAEYASEVAIDPDVLKEGMPFGLFKQLVKPNWNFKQEMRVMRLVFQNLRNNQVVLHFFLLS